MQTFNGRRYSNAVIEICLRWECGGDRSKLPRMLKAYYYAYAWD
jgi:hypothetical protein